MSERPPNPLEVMSIHVEHNHTPEGDVRPYITLHITIAVGEAIVSRNGASAVIRQRDLCSLFTQLFEMGGVEPLWRKAHGALVQKFMPEIRRGRMRLVSFVETHDA